MSLYALIIARLLKPGTPSKENKDACTGDDILLDCLARHRTNPRNLHRVIWHQQKTVELSQVVARSGGPVKDNYTLHQNGSLLVPGILSNVNTSIVFRCTVTKNKRTLPRERHTVFIRFVQCAKQEGMYFLVRGIPVYVVLVYALLFFS